MHACFPSPRDTRSVFDWLVVAGLLTSLTAALTFYGSSVQAQDVAAAPQVVSLERRPYQIRLLIAFDGPSFDQSSSQSILRDVKQSTQRCAGDVWSLDAAMTDSLSPVNASGLKRLDRSFIAKQENEAADVWFAAAIETLPIGFRVSARSWQPDVQLESPVISRDVIEWREIPLALVRLCRDLFQPLGTVEHVDDRSVRIRLRAGELTPPDPSFAQVTRGDLMLPLLAYRDKNKIIEKLQTIPWTYVSIDHVEASTVSGTVQSGLRLALGGKKRGRIDTLVVKLRPHYGSTRVELTTQTKPILPLVAHRIEERSQPIIPRPTEDKPDVDPASTLLEELLTDRRGLSTVRTKPGHPLVWLFAYSGQHLLARVPFVPGVSPFVRLEVPDDSTRLSAEADLQMLQGEVIDAVALRNVAIATIRAASKKNDWDTVQKKLDLIKKQQDAGTLNDRLVAVRVLATAAAKTRKDKAGEARINRMCDETAELIKAHLSDDKLTALREEMKDLENALKDEK